MFQGSYRPTSPEKNRNITDEGRERFQRDQRAAGRKGKPLLILLLLIVFLILAVIVFVNYETDDPNFYYFRGSVYEELGLYERAAEDYMMFLWLTEDAGPWGRDSGFWNS